MRARGVGGALAIALVLTSCSSGSDVERAAVSDSDAPTAQAAGGSVVLAAQPITQAEDRKVVRTAQLVVRVDDAVEATERATTIADAADGFVLSQETDIEGDNPSQLVLKVPPDALDRVLDDLSALGRAVRRSVKADDVTEEYVDVEGRVAALRASTDRLRGLIGEGKTPAEIVAVEGELARREADLEAVQGRLRSLSAQTELATVTLELTERGQPEVSDDIPGFMAGLRAGWAALLNTGQVLATVAGALLPFVVPLGLLGWLAVFVLRRARLRRRAPSPG